MKLFIIIFLVVCLSPLVTSNFTCSNDKECMIKSSWTIQECCEYVTCNSAACEGGGYLEWSKYVKCENRNSLRVLIITIAIIYLLFLFVVMTVVADDFFSPSIAGIVKQLKISESIAVTLPSLVIIFLLSQGVTFLAFGNGAPDIFGSIASVIASPQPKADLAIGDILGGGVFVTTVVLSVIILTKSFRIAALATIRDILFFLLADGFLAICFLKFKKVEIWMPIGFLGIYAFYVITVILMRINSKRRKRLRKQREKTLNQRTPRIATVLNVLMSFTPKINVSPEDIEAFRRKMEDSEGLIDWECDDEGEEAEFVIAHRQVFKSFDQVSIKSSGCESESWNGAIWEHLSPFSEIQSTNWFLKFIYIVSILPTFLCKLTIPSNEKSWCKPVLMIHCFTSIQFLLFAIQISNKSPFHGSPGIWIYGFGVSIVLVVLVLIFAPMHKEPKYYKEVYSYFGFLMSISWIYVVSSEIINVITMLGVETGVSQEILGLTIMAWSNCIGDIVSDIAVVKQGFPKMAMAAAIGGPLFNLLIGFGLPFTIACLQGKHIALEVTPGYQLLMLFLAISLVTSLVAIFAQKFIVQWPHAVCLIFVFLIFLVFVLLSELNVL